ncbi:MAG: tetratricopeptide repeat protein [Pseudomonadota bacterium]
MRKHLLTLGAAWLLLGCASRGPAPPLASLTTPTLDSARTEAIFKLLLADTAAQRGDHAKAVAQYIAVAEQAGDATLARQAVQVALYAQDMPAAIAAAEAWQRIEPQNVDAAQLLTGLELQQGNPDKAREHLRHLLTLKQFQSRQDYLNLVRLLNQNVPPDTLFGVLDALLEMRPDDPQALFAYCLAATGLGQAERADKPSAHLLAMQPQLDEAVLLRAQVLLQTGQASAAGGLLRDFLDGHPRHTTARLTLARVLLEGKDYAAARQEFETVLRYEPRNADARLASALLAGQLGDRRAARRGLLTLASDGKQADQANYYLGKLAEDAADPQEALARYAKVEDGEHRAEALLRRASLLAERGDLDGGVSLLAAAASESDEERLRFLLAQSDLLLNGNRPLQAEALINEALAHDPNSMELLFARSMVLDKLNRRSEMEQDLKRILELDPKNANALNAWGYTLADRGERLDEAHDLINRALEQSPDNPYILDSLGWVLYRKGDLVAAEAHLRRALGLLPDAEVYAHLAEVLHAQGRTAEAREVLREGLKKSPTDARLLGVQSKLDP